MTHYIGPDLCMGRVVCSYRHAKGVVRLHPSCWRRRHAKGVVGLHPGCWLRNPDLRGQLDLGELNERERPLPFDTSAVANRSQSAGRDGRPTVHVIVFDVSPALLHTAPPVVQTSIKAERGLPEGLFWFWSVLTESCTLCFGWVITIHSVFPPEVVSVFFFTIQG